MSPAQRSLLAVALSALAAGAAPAQPPLLRDGVPHTDPQIAAELPRFLTARAAHFLDWLGDGSMLISVEQGEARRIERLRAPLAEAQAAGLPPGTAASAIVARPYTSDAFVFAALEPSGARAGSSEAAGALQLSLQQIDAGARPLAATATDAGLPAWAHDGKQLAFIGADGGVELIDTAAAGASARALLPGGAARWRVLGWAIDDQSLLVGRHASDDGAQSGGDPLELYLASVKDGALQPVAPPGARARLRSVKAEASPSMAPGAAVRATEARFASDGRAILLLTHASCARRGTDAGGRFLHLCYTDPAAGDWRAVTAATAHDVELFDASPDGSWIAYTLNEDGVSRLMLRDVRLQLDRAIDALAPGVVTALKFDATGKRLALGYESPGSPPEVDVLDPATASLLRWTQSDATVLEAAARLSLQVVHFPTWDEVDGEPRQLSALLYAPSGGATAGMQRPVVIRLCGADGHRCRATYDPFLQFLVQRLGFVVLVANVRSAASPGSLFPSGASAVPRDDAVRDVGALLVWIGLQPQLDRDRVALIGEGFGSYLALGSLAEFGDRLSGAVAAFPARFGPMPNALAIHRPVLLVQGLADREVPAYQIAQLREALRAGGVPVQYLAAVDEGRRFLRAANREAYGEAAATFLARLLR